MKHESLYVLNLLDVAFNIYIITKFITFSLLNCAAWPSGAYKIEHETVVSFFHINATYVLTPDVCPLKYFDNGMTWIMFSYVIA